MGFKMKGWSPFTKRASDEDLDRYDQAYYEYHKGDRSKESGKKILKKLKRPGDIVKNISLQAKWKKFHGKFGGPTADSTENMNWTPEQRAQKNIDDKLYADANKMAQHGSTDAVKSAQGVHYEKIYYEKN